MRLDRLLTLYLAHPILKLVRENSAISILMYHRISDSLEPTLSPYYKLNTSPSVFRQHLQTLKEEGCIVVDLPTCLAMLGNGPVVGQVVVITFDDGYEDLYTEAFPILEQYRFPATVFLPTAFIGDSPRSFRNTPCLTWSQVNEMRRHGIDFGSHTVSHPKLRELSWQQINDELRNSRQTIEDNLQEPITTFAYPYAYPETDRQFGARFRECLQATGYQLCVTTRIGRASPGDDPFALKRLPANGCDDRELLCAKLRGGYDWLCYPQRIRKMARLQKRTSISITCVAA